jgi:hypothetical protein
VINPLGTGQVFQFTFWQTGTKYVRVVVTDAQGRTATIEHDVVVIPHPMLFIPPPPPTASFSYSPPSPLAGSPVTFDGSSSTCPAGPCFYAWSDDGAPNGPSGHASSLGSGSQLQYAFTTSGTKYVRLVLTDVMGRTATIEHDVVVSAIGVQSYTVNSTKIAALLSAILVPHGKAAKINALLAHGGYSFAWSAPSAGRLVITWNAHRARQRTPVLVGKATHSFSRARRATIKVVLTPAGRRLLHSARRLSVSAKGSFTPTGASATAVVKGFTLTP